ncbi:helix-turn-helix domain-containing protein [Salinicoccus roseus]|uniref:helix-turn-helix domain-containing protein n=1 Tax=Salinicoccus roseus TaxID=45670 RepID=UPI001EF62327|nr:helix-turn-helix transcriptional regulator [Salinicoccus roseus]MCG7333569.1 helix-turn-helix domain-containing protein [Salinicoccus roseus]
MDTNKNKSEVLREIGKNIRQYRKQKGWSQEDLAFECKFHRTYIGAVERGEKNITILNLLKIKEQLGVRLVDLYPEE